MLKSSSSTPNSNVISSALNSTSANTFGSNSNIPGSISSTKTPNAPGPPQIDGKVSVIFFASILFGICNRQNPKFIINKIGQKKKTILNESNQLNHFLNIVIDCQYGICFLFHRSFSCCMRTSTQLSYSTTIFSHIQQQSQQNFQSNNISATLNSQSKSTSSSKLSNAPASPQIDTKVKFVQ